MVTQIYLMYASEMDKRITYTRTAVRLSLLDDAGCPRLANEIGKDAFMRSNQFVVVRLLGVRLVGGVGGQRQLAKVVRSRVISVLLITPNTMHVVLQPSCLTGEELSEVLNLP